MQSDKQAIDSAAADAATDAAAAAATAAATDAAAATAAATDAAAATSKAPTLYYDVVNLVLRIILANFTWMALYRYTGESEYGLPSTKRYRGPVGELKYEEILSVQELKRVCTLFNRVVTAWFVKEWDAKSWADLFRRFSDYGGYPPLSARVAARDYFEAFTKHDLLWDHCCRNLGESFSVFVLRTDDLGIKFQEEMFITILVYGSVCVAEYDARRYRYSHCWDLETGVCVDPRSWCNVPVDTPYCGQVLVRPLGDRAQGYNSATMDELSELVPAEETPLSHQVPMLVNPGFAFADGYNVPYVFRWRRRVHITDKSGQKVEIPEVESPVVSDDEW